MCAVVLHFSFRKTTRYARNTNPFKIVAEIRPELTSCEDSRMGYIRSNWQLTTGNRQEAIGIKNNNTNINTYNHMNSHINKNHTSNDTIMIQIRIPIILTMLRILIVCICMTIVSGGHYQLLLLFNTFEALSDMLWLCIVFRVMFFGGCCLVSFSWGFV